MTEQAAASCKRGWCLSKAVFVLVVAVIVLALVLALTISIFVNNRNR